MDRHSSSSNSRFDVFEFNEDDERVEFMARKLLRKVENPRKSHHSPVTKYRFLECFSRGTATQQKEITNKPIDVDAEDRLGNELLDVGAGSLGNECLYPMGMPLQGRAIKEEKYGSDIVDLSDSSDRKLSAHARAGYLESGSLFLDLDSSPVRVVNLGETSVGSGCLRSTLIRSLSNDEPVGIISDEEEEEKIEMSNSSTSASSPTESEVPLNGKIQECDVGGCEINNVIMTVVVFPDFVLYGDSYCMESRLTFSCKGIKLEASAVNGIKKRINVEWTVGDINKIESQWCKRVESATVNLHFKSKCSEGAEKPKEVSGFEELMFAINDSHWLEQQEAIKLLDKRYKETWNVIFDINEDGEENVFFGKNKTLFSNPFFFDSDEHFEDVIYPRGDPYAISISKRDVELLQPETFINDNIIDFYLTYLKNDIHHDERHRFHFFNCFFFRKLADLSKDPSSTCGGREAFQRVRKWTKNINLFEMDYIFIPVNYSLHWSLIVICHPGEVPKFKDEEYETLPKVPCILHMDSIKGSHRGIKNLVQSYLFESWKDRHGKSEISEDIASKFLELRFVPLELPQQENCFDCGLFLLHYVELFLEEAPVSFNPYKITKCSNFLSKNWFPPVEASLKRAHIHKIIYEILEEYSQKDPAADSENNPSSQLLESIEQDTEVELLKEINGSTRSCHATSASSEQCIMEFGSISRELYESGTSSFGTYQRTAQVCQRNIMPTVEEVEETHERNAHSSFDREENLAGSTTKFSPKSYLGNDCGLQETSWNRVSMHLEDDGDFPTHSFSKTSKLGVPEEDLHPKVVLDIENSESASTSSDNVADCVVQDSQEVNSIHDTDESNNSLSFQESTLADNTSNNNLKTGTVAICSEGPVAESDERQAAKRRRLTSILQKFQR